MAKSGDFVILAIFYLNYWTLANSSELWPIPLIFHLHNLHTQKWPILQKMADSPKKSATSKYQLLAV